MFTTDNASIVDSAIEAGILPCLAAISEHASTQLIHYILFTLSNIAAGTEQQTIALLSEHNLVLKVFQMAMNADQKLKCEALWTICNAIETLEPANLLTFVSKYNDQLIMPLCVNLIKLAKGETRLLSTLIDTIELLLNLDQKFSGQHEPIRNTIDACEGFEYISEL